MALDHYSLEPALKMELDAMELLLPRSKVSILEYVKAEKREFQPTIVTEIRDVVKTSH